VVKPVYLLDSFEGLPPITEKDGANAEAFMRRDWGAELDNCVVDVADVRRRLADMEFAENDYHVVKGWFDDSLPGVVRRIGNEQICVLRIDADWYDSVTSCLTHLIPLVTIGSAVIIDDYYVFDGCARAVHDYLAVSKRPVRLTKPTHGDGVYFLNRPPGKG
jgi:hypothetical protein